MSYLDGISAEEPTEDIDSDSNTSNEASEE